MSHHTQKVLEAIFSHPVSANIDIRDVESVLKKLGAEVDDKGQKISVVLNGRTMMLHRPHQHMLPKDEVSVVRGFLIDCGIDPANTNT